MNRARKRRMQEVTKKHPQAVEDIINYERNSIIRIIDLDKEQLFEILRRNRIGKERATKIISEVYEEL